VADAEGLKQSGVAVETPPGVPLRGRGKKVRAAVLGATLAELTEGGYAALSMEKVAHRSGVHKTTVYRRWKDRDALVTDAVIDMAATNLPLEDNEDIDADLRSFARSLVQWLNEPTGRAVLAILWSDAARLPQVAQAKRRLFADRVRRAEPLVHAAIARGQLPAGTDPAELIKTVIAPIYLRLLVTAEAVTPAVADAAVGIALSAARAGLLRSRDGRPAMT
jgi:AcrR family transcriptional regulator